MCPPIKMIPETLKFIMTNKIRGILIIPRWFDSVYWPQLFKNGKFLPCVTHYMFSNGNFGNVNNPTESIFKEGKSNIMVALVSYVV